MTTPWNWVLVGGTILAGWASFAHSSRVSIVPHSDGGTCARSSQETSDSHTSIPPSSRLSSLEISTTAWPLPSGKKQAWPFVADSDSDSDSD